MSLRGITEQKVSSGIDTDAGITDGTSRMSPGLRLHIPQLPSLSPRQNAHEVVGNVTDVRFLPKIWVGTKMRTQPDLVDDGSFSHNFEFQLRCRGQGVMDGFSQRTETSNTVSSSETIYMNTQISQTIPEEVQGHFGELHAVILRPFIVISGR